MEKNYTPEDGIKLMDLLGYQEYTSQDKREGFVERWNKNYLKTGREPILTAWAYVDNPFHRHSDSTSGYRAARFIKSLKNIEPEQWTQNLNLEQIVDKIKKESEARVEKSRTEIREWSTRFRDACEALTSYPQ